MKFSVASSLAVLAAVANATPTPTVVDGAVLDPRAVEKRATFTDACDVGYGAGTTGGAGGATTTVSTVAQFTAAVASEDPAVIVVQGAITGAAKARVASNKTVIGLPGSSLTGVGLYVNKVENVILRNLKIAKVEADNGDAIGIQASSRVWVDHCDLSSDRDNGKDFYDGLLDITHAAMAVTVSNTYLHDHYKTSLIGHSDSNAAEDTGKLFVTYANNYWKNLGSRTPSVRFGNVHIFNNYEEDVDTSGVNTRMGAQVLIESSVFSSVERAITSLDSKETGYATCSDVDLGGSTNDAPKGNFTKPAYSYTVLGASNVKAAVTSSAGQTLTF
ncbi:pectate lyase [Colletotrichum graminicola]|uniref:pectate lyase n=1 Tax=Colletotrichum graminicola (strain M1.001 / M2 / FGSC 10212) TaxID=645133 RepID=E3QKM3_COLGM|nr:pectate lyase [Colletotrichum graminicola M1.001]EFQ31411.1 pectate lyase [Colletotrichum graminicola M1.001]WDK19690.1 pectate lyase [Colletotrichum graminicola]